MRQIRRSSISIRRLKVIFTLFVFGILLFIINTYFQKGQKEINIKQDKISTLKEQDIFPIYKDSKLSISMSHTGMADPHIFVFLSKDDYKKVINFYKNALNESYYLKEIVYKNKIMTIYQFRSKELDKKFDKEKELKKGKKTEKEIKVLNDYITKGVEIIPLNHLWERVLQAKTKIKIIIPRNTLYKKAENKDNKEENK